MPAPVTVWTPERLDVLRTLVDLGMKSDDIGAEMGVSGNAIRLQCMLNGIKLQYKRGSTDHTDPLGVMKPPQFFTRWTNARFIAANKERPSLVLRVYRPDVMTFQDERDLEHIVGWWTGVAYTHLFADWAYSMVDKGFFDGDDVDREISELSDLPVWFTDWASVTYSEFHDVSRVPYDVRVYWHYFMCVHSLYASSREDDLDGHCRRLEMLGRIKDWMRASPVRRGVGVHGFSKELVGWCRRYPEDDLSRMVEGIIAIESWRPKHDGHVSPAEVETSNMSPGVVRPGEGGVNEDVAGRSEAVDDFPDPGDEVSVSPKFEAVDMLAPLLDEDEPEEEDWEKVGSWSARSRDKPAKAFRRA